MRKKLRTIPLTILIALVVGLLPSSAFADLHSGPFRSELENEVNPGSGARAVQTSHALATTTFGDYALVNPQATGSTSGVASLKPTLAELKEAWRALPDQPMGRGLFTTINDLSSYTPATLSSDALAYASAYTNFIRKAAGLDSVEFDPVLNANAAQGALILAKRGPGLTHFPETPEGVTDAQAKAGKYACATSNLSVTTGSDALQSAIQGQIDDAGVSNMQSLGHRRWLLNPSTSTFGIGSAMTSYDMDGWVVDLHYTDIRVFTNPYNENYDPSYGAVAHAGSTDYDYVAWPASGAFPNNVFQVGTPWSVSLNPNKFETPSLDEVTVRVTRLSDGASWTMSSSDSTVSTSEKYLNVDSGGYGEGSCIVFNPGSANVGADSYEGTYRVDVMGLKSASGTATSMSYEVEFADLRTSLASASIELSNESYVYDGSAKEPSVTVKLDGVQVPSSGYRVSYSNNIGVGLATVTVTGMGSYTGTASKTFSIVANPTDTTGGGNSATIQPMHRLYNPNSGEHFYTASDGERDMLMSIGWRSEGRGWTAPTASSTPVYRLYNPNAGEHHYTTNAAERDMLKRVGWKYEGIGWYSDDAQRVPLYRVYNPNAFANNHHYTVNAAERDHLVRLGWKNEGRAWYGV